MLQRCICFQLKEHRIADGLVQRGMALLVDDGEFNEGLGVQEEEHIGDDEGLEYLYLSDEAFSRMVVLGSLALTTL